MTDASADVTLYRKRVKTLLDITRVQIVDAPTEDELRWALMELLKLAVTGSITYKQVTGRDVAPNIVVGSVDDLNDDLNNAETPLPNIFSFGD